MLTAPILVGCVTILVMVLLVIVVIGIHQEPPAQELSEQAPRLLAAAARRMLGLHVRKPYSPADSIQNDQAMSMRKTPCTSPVDKPNLK